MSRTPLIAGNWKMNRTVPESVELARAIVAGLPRDLDGVEVVLLPPFTSLWPVSEAVADSRVALGAQDIYWEASGAYTGEVSAAMVSGWCRYALIGHSERRRLFGETDATVNRKVHAALAHGLRPMVAVGETLEEREAGQTEAMLSRQVPEALIGLDERQGLELVMAYEPVWAIGTGRTATADQAEEACGLIRRLVAQALGTAVAESVRILYGGSVVPANARELLAPPNVDGALVGGASLKADDFLAIVAAALPAAAGGGAGPNPAAG
ncbi:MAG TPA: triose-phosphate isomerase [Candidatus Dormibacteraeota bacterium]|nr:triose-phosphate isomerase [Candidatus Dormibacteraeota bacterium]